jgi:hypothetical protein
MLAIADEFERQRLEPQDCSLRIGIFGAEPWTESVRTEIERRMGIDALDAYELSEVIGPGVAQECAETKDGLTLWEDHFFPEIIDPDTGRVMADGEAGELVLTSLTKQGMPVIRYRTRDLTRLLPGTASTMHPNGLSLEYCCVVGNRPENAAMSEGEFTVPRAALELNNALSASRLPTAQSAHGRRARLSNRWSATRARCLAPFSVGADGSVRARARRSNRKSPAAGRRAAMIHNRRTTWTR